MKGDDERGEREVPERVPSSEFETKILGLNKEAMAVLNTPECPLEHSLALLK